ncbi:acyl-CoA N-acyltransferase [Lasiosphaeria miniovina]|uniref:Acyl-CoA N-acyltransferase n=1 Tax=Lasiosphaeria miniovina TaxID=1954250 RepID=A0AA40EA37_9PEZI|nr:acyl-CoA N-acyltransferase [Lasiosphaeria miniovina]KAK0733999.1 acyl-CoA N-acyltransferase [Lasiosphaeria miniovina]
MANPAPQQPGHPILTLSRCVIRPFAASDAAALQAAADDPAIARQMRNACLAPITSAEDPLLNFAICTPPDHAGTTIVCGGIGLKRLADVESRTLEVGYWLGRDVWGRGIATEALAAFTRWAFEHVVDPAAAGGPVQRIEACVFGDNDASARVLTKAGYVLEGSRRKAGFKNGKPFDIRLFGILREEVLGSQ